MKLIIGSILLVIGELVLAVCYLGARNPREPWWTRESVMGQWLVPLALGAAALGTVLVIDEAYHFTELQFYKGIIALAILGVGVVFTLALRIPKRLKAYDAIRNTPEIIDLLAKRKAGRKPLPTNGSGAKRVA